MEAITTNSLLEEWAMGDLFFLKAKEAYIKSRTDELANAIWNYKHPGEPINFSDREYISWKNSLPLFLDCVKDAGLDEVYVVFEMKTPISNKSIDVLLVGYSHCYENRVLIVELKQWNSIYTGKVYDQNKVYIPEAGEARRHPFKQLNLYANNLRNHHSGIQKEIENGGRITFGKIAYLHNCDNVLALKTDKYSKWSSFDGFVFGKGAIDKQRLINTLQRCFISEGNHRLLDILSDYEAVMGDEGLAGLKKAYSNEASLSMMKDQQDIVKFIINRLSGQKESPHKEIVVISGGPGTGKTIVGIRFILEYVDIFNGGRNDNKVIFCLPKSQTVKAMFDAACSVDEEYEKEYCCYLQEIGRNQNLVVVDEAHRITKLEETLDKVFEKGTNMLIMLQDDHQMLRPGEEGTFQAIKDYALGNGIQFSPMNGDEEKLLTLIDEKRCDEKLLKGLTNLFFDDSTPIGDDIDCVRVFNNLSDLETWKNEQSLVSKTKYIFPFCWQWKSRNAIGAKDILIGGFSRQWNPEDTDEQVIWLNDNKDDRVACIYTSQGLDMDNVAFVWWDDLVWDEVNSKWTGHIEMLKDPAFRTIYDNTTGLWREANWDRNVKANVVVKGGFSLSQEEIDFLIKNTYYVMLSRPRKKVGIWFKNEATKKHVLDVLGIVAE